MAFILRGSVTPELVISGVTVTLEYVYRRDQLLRNNGLGDHLLKGPIYFVTRHMSFCTRSSNWQIAHGGLEIKLYK